MLARDYQAAGARRPAARCSRLVSIRPDAGEPSRRPPTRGRADDLRLGRRHRRLRRAFRPGATAVRRRRDAGRRGAGAAGARYGLRRRARRRGARAARHRAGRGGARRHGRDARRARDGVRDDAAGGADLAAVVASQGHYDEEALETILQCGVPYVGLVASRTRGAAVRAMLEGRAVPGLGPSVIRRVSIWARGLRRKSRCRSSPRSSRPIPTARAGGGTGGERPTGRRTAGARDRRRSGLRHERGRRLGAPHGGARRRHLLLLLRELPRASSSTPQRIPGAS